MITQTLWGRTIEGEDINLYTLTNRNQSQVKLSDIGAGIISISVPDRDKHLDDVVLGYATPEEYFGDGPCAGKIPGRFANRIDRGHFSIDGIDYQLDLNTGDGLHHLHGGKIGFANRVWKSKIVDNSVVFTHFSPDGEDKYPGNLTAQATYIWTDDNELILTLEASTDAPTIINLTNHAYFNLNGEGKGNILKHKLKLFADNYLPATKQLITTGEIAPVAGTPMDFRTLKYIGQDINNPFEALINGKGYDSCWLINGEKGTLRKAAELESEKSGRRLEIFTTQNGVQVYTGNWLSGCPIGKRGTNYADYDGVALECQALPDAPNKPNFPKAVLRPSEKYNQIIKFKFSTY